MIDDSWITENVQTNKAFFNRSSFSKWKPGCHSFSRVSPSSSAIFPLLVVISLFFLLQIDRGCNCWLQLDLGRPDGRSWIVLQEAWYDALFWTCSNLEISLMKGIDHLKFKPAYNPYTEPSMEVFSYHPGLNKVVEIGNSGTFVLKVIHYCDMQ